MSSLCYIDSDVLQFSLANKFITQRSFAEAWKYTNRGVELCSKGDE